jgi:hypothetical protein
MLSSSFAAKSTVPNLYDQDPGLNNNRSVRN